MIARMEGEKLHFGLAAWEGLKIALEAWMPAREATLLSRAFTLAICQAKHGATAEDAWEMGTKSIQDDALAIARYREYKQCSESAAGTPTHALEPKPQPQGTEP